MDRAADEMKKQGVSAFYPHFYAGRLYDRSGGKNEWIALDRFQKAMSEAIALQDDALYDNALWYYLSGALKISVPDALSALEQFGATFRDKTYYDDFFDTLAVGLLNGKQWNTFYSAAQIVERIAGGESRSKYTYLAGRLLQSGLAKSKSNAEHEAEDLFRKACEPSGNIYYTFLASHALGISTAELQRMFFSNQQATKKQLDDSTENGADRLLLGFADYGFPERIYNEWLNYRESVDTETVIKLAEFLQNCDEEIFRIQGLRMISRTVLNDALPGDSQTAMRALKLVYPQFLKNEITAACDEFELLPPYIFALTRSESFFEAEASSHAGARGLTQLMDSTAADIARKLKMQEYDIFDTQTNLRFGAFYFAEMLSRLDGNVLASYFAYNAGISRVRTWISSAKGLPQDLFLETIPFAETRAYGKNVVAAICLYAWLYDNTPPNETINAIFK
jgi:soluble lytic murein transglycosylase